MAEDLAAELHQLFKASFIINCELEEAQVAPEELKTLDELETAEVLENLRELVGDLLTFKKNCRLDDKAQMARQLAQFEEMLQKLEGEVRGHISIQHQLRLHLDSAQSQLEEVENSRLLVRTKTIDSIKAEHAQQLQLQQEDWTQRLRTAEQQRDQNQQQLETALKEIERLKKSLDALARQRMEKIVMKGYGLKPNESRPNKLRNDQKRSENRLPIKLTRARFASEKLESQSFHLFNRSIDELKPAARGFRSASKHSYITRAPSR